ncbi:hypothetical protein L838_3051 [Mycobacterium avium MAV_120709_2344]|nr:hypothetical protein L839_2799 [Mycobacterium avium MAV_120809_2495]ETZ51619.1 hypothetical protein L838_3051 [Mycobacterium avium MAV_120709_2344]
MGCQQLGVAAVTVAVSSEAHGRTVTNRVSRGTSLAGAHVSACDAPGFRTRPGP